METSLWPDGLTEESIWSHGTNVLVDGTFEHMNIWWKELKYWYNLMGSIGLTDRIDRHVWFNANIVLTHGNIGLTYLSSAQFSLMVTLFWPGDNIFGGGNIVFWPGVSTGLIWWTHWFDWWEDRSDPMEALVWPDVKTCFAWWKHCFDWWVWPAGNTIWSDQTNYIFYIFLTARRLSKPKQTQPKRNNKK